jgi:hypothetical protein
MGRSVKPGKAGKIVPIDVQRTLTQLDETAILEIARTNVWYLPS